METFLATVGVAWLAMCLFAVLVGRCLARLDEWYPPAPPYDWDGDEL